MEDYIVRGPMSLNAKHITEEYGGLDGYHEAVATSLYALACVECKLSADGEKDYLAIVQNHIAVLGGLLEMGLEEMEPAQVLGLAVSRGMLDDD